ncbi:type III secretion system cytoplasmic ring protein SctQ [Noviherbaspirillum sp.]|uniref:type III secretion system cytoplasmic ring protein SctQ n=1 Tax=Noviherbaspirillum sp. TaxID=1926288 RepID=UPI002B4626CA|nr:type III secretion system cytoplasmic ring protein SctQ [Noviherbaspirillum sp.]HJV80571.1 type III secretion system cytoplasmic ring protein SctQ [Noviherbaspirillum sp.]
MKNILLAWEDELVAANAESATDKRARSGGVVSLPPPRHEIREQIGNEMCSMRPRLRSVDKDAVAAINQLAVGRRWSGLGRDPIWNLALTGPVSSPQRPADILLAASWEGVHCVLALSYASAETLLEVKWGDMALNEVPPDLALALLQDAVDELSRDLAGEELGPIRIDGWATAEQACAVPFAMDLRMTRHDGGDPASARLLTDLQGLTKLARLAARAESEPPKAEPWAGLPILLTLELGWVDMTLDEIATIRPQDVLLPDGWWSGKGRKDLCIRISPKLGIGAQFTIDEHLRATTKVKRMEQDDSLVQHPGNAQLPTNSALPAVESGVAELADIPLRITFDLGERHIPLRELASIAPGHLFDLGLAPDSAVNLRINGVRVGEGELVEIGGRIGVAVMRIAAPH